MDEINYETILSEVFPHLSLEHLRDTIAMVLEENNDLTSGEKLDAMCNILVDSADTLEVATSSYDVDDEGATGLTPNSLDQYFDRFKTLFPDICPEYLSQHCRSFEVFNFDTIVQDLGRS